MQEKRISSVLKDNKGMALFQFMLMLFAVFVVIAMFIEIGAVLRSEAILVNSATKLVKTVQIHGELLQHSADPSIPTIDSERLLLANYGIPDLQVSLVKGSTPSGPVIAPGAPLLFRQNFTLIVRAQYQTKFGGFLAGASGISFPIGITLSGKSEFFRAS